MSASWVRPQGLSFGASTEISWNPTQDPGQSPPGGKLASICVSVSLFVFMFLNNIVVLYFGQLEKELTSSDFSPVTQRGASGNLKRSIILGHLLVTEEPLCSS